MDNFNFETLKIFLIVSKFRSFSQAGNYLYLDPSTISKKIRQLEKAVDQQLFIRTSQGVELTTAGIAFKVNAQKLLVDLKKLTTPPTINWGILRIGILDNIAAYHYPQLISNHLSQFKELKISVKGIELVHLFNEGHLDAIILNEEQHQEITGEFYEAKLSKEPFGVIAGRQTSLPPTTSLKKLKPNKLIIAPRYCPVSQQLLSLFDSAKDIKQVSYTNTVLELIAQSAYLSILPWQMIQSLTGNDHRFHASKLVDFPPRTISLFTRSHDIQSFLVNHL